MSIFQTGSGAPRRRRSRNHCSKPVRTRESGILRSAALLPRAAAAFAANRARPADCCSLSKRRIGDPVFLHAGDRRLEPVALETRRAAPGRRRSALPGAELGFLAGLDARDITADTGAAARRAPLSRTRCTSSRPTSMGARPRASPPLGRSQRAAATLAKRCWITQSTCSGGLGGNTLCSMKPGNLATACWSRSASARIPRRSPRAHGSA